MEWLDQICYSWDWKWKTWNIIELSVFSCLIIFLPKTIHVCCFVWLFNLSICWEKNIHTFISLTSFFCVNEIIFLTLWKCWSFMFSKKKIVSSMALNIQLTLKQHGVRGHQPPHTVENMCITFTYPKTELIIAYRWLEVWPITKRIN